jgi:hypothetical protein
MKMHAVAQIADIGNGFRTEKASARSRACEMRSAAIFLPCCFPFSWRARN